MSKVCWSLFGIIFLISPLALPGVILIMILVCVCLGGIDLTEQKENGSKHMAKSAFQSRMPRKLSETVPMFEDDSGSEDLIPY